MLLLIFFTTLAHLLILPLTTVIFHIAHFGQWNAQLSLISMALKLRSDVAGVMTTAAPMLIRAIFTVRRPITFKCLVNALMVIAFKVARLACRFTCDHADSITNQMADRCSKCKPSLVQYS